MYKGKTVGPRKLPMYFLYIFFLMSDIEFHLLLPFLRVCVCVYYHLGIHG